MIQYPYPVRNNTPQSLSYTFKNQSKAIIDLTAYVSCFMEIKLQGQVYSSIAASIGSPPSAGVVTCSSYTFTQIGVWNVQFKCVDGSGDELFGEPLQVNVVANNEDLALTQLAAY